MLLTLLFMLLVIQLCLFG